ncbi:hypothetical protein AVEN_195652-1 [Araneus ventricosus]|uniref:Uncharacterized protein n=1 Tax=Araneus ventricosus TaxID=182803 RepID=A0A4Y2BC26_ARAVE|nr:hypothetical protein AVEN_195652-1 [Araneus ventricosus]
MNVDFNFFDPKSQVKKKLKKKAMDIWQESWFNSTKGRVMREFFDRPKKLKGDIFLNQIFAGHGIFKTYQNGFSGKTEKGNCGADKGDAKHLFLEGGI